MADTTFTPLEQKILITILSNLKGDIDADWAKVAEVHGYKDAGIARKRWQQIRKQKIDRAGGENSTTSPPKKRTKKQADEADVEGGGEDQESKEGQANKPKKGGHAAKKIKTEIKEDPEDEAEPI
ncbi:hypothetical protein KVT40_001321 [Elsinoe batatas]|uniref:Myb-like DNA-binding domain-containing protein n=1 Tax=Elsinoe batatas TaxID=2601811 RepID=A0A8K0PIN9_9PEZI|nr:hypothetical protein KVT40_001321 [Elsinoe batatas]